MSSRFSFSLNLKLVTGCLVMLGFSLVFSVSLIFIFKSKYDKADLSLQLLAYYRQVLVAANSVAAERGPTNALLGEEPMADGPLPRKLAAFRALSDAALDAIKPPAWPGEDGTGLPAEAVSIAAVRGQLARAREQVDRVIALPQAERTPELVSATIYSMFGFVHAIRPLISAAIVKIDAQDTALAGPALMAQMLGELREHSGRLASYIIPFVAARKPLPADVADEMNRALGRISELWLLAERQAGLYENDPRLAAARQDVNRLFFGSGLPLVFATAAAGRASGNYGLTVAELTDRYVPTLAPVEQLRSVFLDLTTGRPAAARTSALYWLIGVCVITGLCIFANIALIWAAKRLIFRPLLTARDQIIALSEGRETSDAKDPVFEKEMRHLFIALEDLRLRLRERLHYTELLKVQAGTDSLTGLMNRRLFDRIGDDHDDLPDVVGLIMMDIDHFKYINDTFGHPAGDRLLQCAAQIVLAEAGHAALAARYGGEEFAIVLPGCSLSASLDIAARIRAALEAAIIKTVDGHQLNVTASFGVAAGSRRGGAWPLLVSAADSALYAAKCGGRNRVAAAGDAPVEVPGSRLLLTGSRQKSWQ